MEKAGRLERVKLEKMIEQEMGRPEEGWRREREKRRMARWRERNISGNGGRLAGL